MTLRCCMQERDGVQRLVDEASELLRVKEQLAEAEHRLAASAGYQQTVKARQDALREVLIRLCGGVYSMWFGLFQGLCPAALLPTSTPTF